MTVLKGLVLSDDLKQGAPSCLMAPIPPTLVLPVILVPTAQEGLWLQKTVPAWLAPREYRYRAASQMWMVHRILDWTVYELVPESTVTTSVVLKQMSGLT